MTVRFRSLWAVGLLVVVHLAALIPEVVAPYDYSTQFRDHGFAPPTRVRFVDSDGRLSFRPWVDVRTIAGDRTDSVPLRFFVPGPPRQFGPWVLERRLFGVEEPWRMFLLGTDGSGRDVLSRLLYGARISLFAGLLAGGLAALLGLVLGVAAGFYGGRLDELLMRLIELFLALPWLYLLFGVRAVLPLELGPVQVFGVFVLIVGGIGWARPARLFRGVASGVREQDFVLAARGLGASDRYLIWRHVLPQCRGVFWTQVSLLVPRFVLAEVTLSFLGLGVGEPMPSWGNMLTGSNGLQVLTSYTWMMTPAVALLIVVLCYEPIVSSLGSRGRLGRVRVDQGLEVGSVEGPR